MVRSRMVGRPAGGGGGAGGGAVMAPVWPLLVFCVKRRAAILLGRDVRQASAAAATGAEADDSALSAAALPAVNARLRRAWSDRMNNAELLRATEVTRDVDKHRGGGGGGGGGGGERLGNVCWLLEAPYPVWCDVQNTLVEQLAAINSRVRAYLH